MQRTAAILKVSDLSEATKGSTLWKSGKKLPSNYSTIHSLLKNKDIKKAKRVMNKSTLSLHIAAYENSFEALSVCSKIGEKAHLIQKCVSLNGSTSVIQNLFEFPRQQEGQKTDAEIAHFKASQTLLNPNLSEDGHIAQQPQQQPPHPPQPPQPPQDVSFLTPTIFEDVEKKTEVIAAAEKPVKSGDKIQESVDTGNAVKILHRSRRPRRHSTSSVRKSSSKTSLNAKSSSKNSNVTKSIVKVSHFDATTTTNEQSLNLGIRESRSATCLSSPNDETALASTPTENQKEKKD